MLASVVQFYGGLDFYRSALKGLKNRIADMNLLVVLGTTSAFLYSTTVLFAPQLLPPEMRHLYFEGSSAVITFVLLGRYLESQARTKASDFMKQLISLKPSTATVVVDGKTVKVPADSIVKGDTIIVKTGEKIPADGTVVEGEAEVDQSMITGEFMPVLKKKGDTVIGGTVVKDGFLKIHAEKTGKDTFLSQLIEMITEAQEKKPPVGRLADRIVAVFVPAVMVISILVFDIWYLLDKPDIAFISAVSVLIIACPCALGIATPVAVVSAVGRGAKEGILVKEPSALETISQIDVAVFDKTGTLTEGKPCVKEKIIFNETLLLYAKPVLEMSTHPLSQAVAGEIPHSEKTVEKFVSVSGRGIKAVVDGKEVAVGSLDFLKSVGYKIEESTDRTHVAVGVDGTLTAVFILEDSLKKEAKQVVQFFKSRGLKTVVLSGDKRYSVESICRELGIDVCMHSLMPEEKLEFIKDLQKEGKKVAFIGDGINDAPAMSQADVGIAVTGAQDITKEAGDIVLLKEDIKLVPVAFRLSEKAFSVIKQNLFWAYIYNIMGIPMAGGMLYPIFGILLKPVFAGIAMSLSSVMVVLNSLRLHYTSLEE
ncbi:copper-translocating P-type ATPase [Persephonella sp.]